MTDRPRRRRPLITSTLALRVLASAITLSSFGGMTVFASENLHASNAPLQPAAATATPTPSAAATVTTSRTTTTRRSVTTTSTAALTRTKQS
ncbi:MAG: hypothetical protein E6J35_09125 [Chloroflexi bacterium]|nr:MAG: hypothetical protein E6J35_09125 [Chloroflexota bacterium]